MTDTSTDTAPEANMGAKASEKPREGGFSVLSLFRRPEAGAAAGFILILIFFGYFGWEKNFLTALGTSTWLNFASKVGIIAIPIGFLMIAGGTRHFHRCADPGGRDRAGHVG